MQYYDQLAQGATPTFLVAQDDQLLQLACQEVNAAFPSLAEPGASLRRQSGSSGEPVHCLKMLSRTRQSNPVPVKVEPAVSLSTLSACREQVICRFNPLSSAEMSMISKVRRWRHALFAIWLCCSGGSAKRRKSDGASLPPLSPRALTLTAITPTDAKGDVKEELHMQPTVMEVLRAVRRAVDRGPFIEDTHSRATGLKQPDARPDACSLHSPLIAWPQVVVLWEFKVSNGTLDLNTMLGQQITRSRHVLDLQPERKLVVAVSLTMETLEIVWVEHRDLTSIKVFRSGPQLLSFCSESAGFALLVRLLATPEVDLGFRMDECSVKQLGQYSISEVQLLRYGTAAHGHGSHVYKVTAKSTEFHGDAVLKLHDSNKEVTLCIAPPWAMSTDHTSSLW